MNGRVGANCDSHVYFPELGLALHDSTQNINYMVGIQPLSVSHIPELVESFLGHITPVYDADVLHSASIDGKINELIKALSLRDIILVGPVHLSSLFSQSIQIVTQDVNCWNQYDQIKKDLKDFLPQLSDPVVLLSASMMSEVLIHDFKDTEYTFIDCGSVWDVYAGVCSRSYHRKMNV